MHKIWGPSSEHDVHGGSEVACDLIVHTVPRCVRGVANHDTTESLFAELATQSIRSFAKTVQPKTSSSTYVKRVRGTPPEGLTAQLNVRLHK
jgi:hypothetical protein